jgi:hypothetical protein
MEGYCKELTNVLLDSAKSDAFLLQAASIVEKAAEGQFHRDSIRKEAFTVKVIELSRKENEGQ